MWWSGPRRYDQQGVDTRAAHRDAHRKAGRVSIPDHPEYTDTDLWAQLYSQVKKPSLATATKQLYFQAPPQLEELTRPNLEKKVSELIQEGDYITVTASTLPFDLTLRVTYA